MESHGMNLNLTHTHAFTFCCTKLPNQAKASNEMNFSTLNRPKRSIHNLSFRGRVHIARWNPSLFASFKSPLDMIDFFKATPGDGVL